MVKTIEGEEVFQTINGNFSVTPSNEGYTIAYSADGREFTEWIEPTPAGETLIVTGIPLIPIYWRLNGNNTAVKIQL